MSLEIADIPQALLDKFKEDKILDQIMAKIKDNPDILSSIVANYFTEERGITNRASLEELRLLSQEEVNLISQLRIDAIDRRMEDQDEFNDFSNDVGEILSSFLISSITSLVLKGEVAKLLELIKQ